MPRRAAVVLVPPCAALNALNWENYGRRGGIESMTAYV
jgi:hypothetical protein